MPHVSQETLDAAIAAIPDQNAREAITGAIRGDYEYEVYCDSKKCKGRLLGYLGPARFDGSRQKRIIDRNFRLRPRRFDGQIGVGCEYCGQDSRLAKEEKGIVTDIQPSEEEFLEISKRLQKKKPYEEYGGERKVDGFRFVRL